MNLKRSYLQNRAKYYLLTKSTSTILTILLSTLPGQAFEVRPFGELTSQFIETIDQNTDVHQRFREGNQRFREARFHEALASYQQALASQNETNESSLIIGNILHNAALSARILGQFDIAQSYIEQSIEIAQEHDNYLLLGRSLNEAGVITYNLSQFDLAQNHYKQALEITRTIENQEIETHILDNLGVLHRRQGNYANALDFHQQALTLSEALAEQSIQARILNNIGIVYDLYGDYSKSLRFHLQALAIGEEHRDRFVEGRILSSIGVTFTNIGDYGQAQEFFERALTVTQAIGNQAESGRILNNIGSIFITRGEYENAIKHLEQSLSVHQTINNPIDEAASLSNLALTYWNLGNYSRALTYYQQALTIQQEIGARSGEAYTLAGIGNVSFSTGNYSEALEYFGQSLQIFQEIGAQANVSHALNSIGGLYYTLGELEQALNYYQEALTIRQKIGDRAGLGITLNNIGLVYNDQGNFSEALSVFQNALTVRREIGDLAGEASTLNNIGALQTQQQNYPEAINTSSQALTLYQTIGNVIGEANALTNLGVNYSTLSQDTQALEAFQNALSLFSEAGNREGERFIYSRLGDLLARQGEIELAIVFFKKSVNVTESIRQTVRGLSFDVQQTYTETIAFTYRRLTDLLLQENRILEAQRVLDLLKVQELDDYLRGVERNANTASGIELRQEEQQLFERYQARQTMIIALGQELRNLEQITRNNRTTKQAERIRELRQLLQSARQAFRVFFESEDIQSLVAQLRQVTGAANLELEELNDLQNNLQTLEQNAVILYPLILDDRIELILVTANSPPIRRTSIVNRETLNRTILEFRSSIQNPYERTIFEPAQQLYDWLIRPLEDDLAQAETSTIIYAPDRQLRYIPLAALHDGSQWLIENFQVNNITAASLDDLDNQPFQGELSVLAAAFTEGSYEVEINDLTFYFGGLEFAGKEVENLAQLIPNTDTRINADFNLDIIFDMNDFQVIHLATHATFNPGPPQNSFILFGDGNRATLTDIKNWNFPNVELIVLSACDTALGELSSSNGEEILGFGYLMQLAGADAAIASLWAVNDSGTQILMDAFYSALKRGMTKAQALQTAQRALITGTSVSNNPIAKGLAHPYYWAPFIIIGNGL